ncbi:MAG: NAD-reducing hydrogenase HoxS subunit delta [Syntrophus sp. PtaB.Bin001]|nr:MAG: NAD-reducing hydrogenase HoxS subunit delta [Syntrophus sp. PtaB.Bin001]
MSKIKIATDWLAGCAGCHMSLLDIDDRILQLMESVEFTSSPITDLKHPPKEGVTVGILEGAICNTHNVEVAKQMRERCQILIAMGDCATFGNVPAMRNLCGTQAALKRAYLETESTVDGLIPDSPELGKPLDEVVAVDKVVKVDLFIPGCPPSADALFYALSELLAGRTPVVLPPQYFKYD